MINDKNYNPFFFDQLYSIEDNSWWYNARNELIIYLFSKYFSRCSSFLEVGCGNGCVLQGLNKAFKIDQLIGIDLFSEGLNFAKKRVPKAKLSKINIETAKKSSLPVNCDVVGAFDVLEHLRSDQHVLKKISKINNRGIIITVPQYKFLWSYADKLACHVRRYTKKEITEKLENAGYRVVYLGSFVSLIFPAYVLKRKLIKDKKKTIMKEINPGKMISRILKFIMSIELFFIKLGIRFPFGSSIVVVAYKR